MRGLGKIPSRRGYRISAKGWFFLAITTLFVVCANMAAIIPYGFTDGCRHGFIAGFVTGLYAVFVLMFILAGREAE